MDSIVSKSDLLDPLCIGDFVFVAKTNGDWQIMIITKIENSHIHGRSITTQRRIVIEKSTCKSLERPDEYEIISICPVDNKTYAIFMGIDRKYRIEIRGSKLALTADEKNAILRARSFYTNNSLNDYIKSA